MQRRNLLWIAGAGIATIGVLRKIARYRRRIAFSGRTAVITGGSRGLGLVLARRLGREGANIVILARDRRELECAREELARGGASVLALECDVRDELQVHRVMSRAAEHFGGIDIVINNAGIIQVGPFDHMSMTDFEDAIDVHLFGSLHTIMAALPHMRRAGGGRVVNIASIGGRIPVPHLVPYTASKFALVGLSESLRAELAEENILVTTVCPSLMRTGSSMNAQFKGRFRDEYAWFTAADSLPLVSMSVERAARRILDACRHGDAAAWLGTKSRAASMLHALFPALAAEVLSRVNRLLPQGELDQSKASWSGSEASSRWAAPLLTRLSERAAEKNKEVSQGARRV